MSRNSTVFVGLPGGVDSSVAALRLQNQGYTVVGVFIKVWQPDFLVCNWEQERLDAMRVAAHLGIPFLTCDAEAAYRDEVGMYFVSAYERGLTPNPDVLCNQHVKFGVFLDFALEHGADYVATGHYAKNLQRGNHFELQRGVDTNKDQSYFLWTLTQAQLKHVLLPIGDTTKDLIRTEASAADIPTADKKDSQGVCFLGHIDIPEFLSHFVELAPGVVQNSTGERIGTHQGALAYTLGQRHGFSINTTETNRRPYYVVGKDVEHNIVYVDHTPPHITHQDSIVLEQCNFVTEPPPTKGKTVHAQFRYRQTPFLATLTPGSNHYTITPHQPVQQPAPGQSCVLYDENVLLGGGMIAS